MELLVIALVAAIVLLIAIPFPIHAHGGMYPFEGVEVADRADRDAGSHPRSDQWRP
jgi:hypothetical protein